MTRKFLTFLFTAVLCLALTAVAFAADEAGTVASGTCGDNLTWVLDEDGVLTISGTGEMDEFESYESPWDDNTEITSVVVENGVTSVGRYAFRGCSNMTSATLADSVTSVGRNAFASCKALTDITIGSNVTYIGVYAFMGTAYESDSSNWDTGVKWDGALYLDNYLLEAYLSGSYQVREGTTLIAVRAIRDKDSNYYTSDYLTSISIPDSVLYICGGAFYSCAKLTEVTLSENLTAIESFVFANCESLTSIVIPNSVSYIALNAFAGCSRLESVTLGSSISEIGDGAFGYCTSLASITIPASVTFIGDAFSNSGLTEIIFEGNCPFFTRETGTRDINNELDFSGFPLRETLYLNSEAQEYYSNEGTGDSCFEGVTAYGYYPANNATWTEDMLQDYGGDITWVSYTSSLAGEDETESTEAETTETETTEAETTEAETTEAETTETETTEAEMTEAETTEAETTEAETTVSGESENSGEATAADAETTTATTSGSVSTSDLSIYVLIALVMMLGVSGFMIRKLSAKDSVF